MIRFATILRLGSLGALLVAAVAAVAPPAAAADKVSYRKQVWPILKRHCWSCHSGAKPEGKLSMTNAASLRKGGESGPLLVAGQPARSLLLQMVTGDEPQMPPKGPPLSAVKIALLKRWIAQGAPIDAIPDATVAKVVIPDRYVHLPAVTAIAFSPDGTRIACGCRSEVVVLSADGKGIPQRLPTGGDLVTHVEFSPDGKWLAVAGGSPSRFGLLTVFDTATAKAVSTRRVSNDTLFRGGFSPDGKRLALGGADGAVYVVPLDPKAKLRRIELHSDWVVDVAWTPDGKTLITAGRDKTTKLASVKTGKLLRTVDSSNERVAGVATDGAFAISGGKARTLTGFQLSIALQNISVTGAGNGAKPVTRRNQYAKAFEAQPGEINDIAISGNRKSIAVAGRATEIRVYTIADRKRTATISGVRAPVYGVALNTDATLLAVGSRDGHVEVFRLPKGEKLWSLVPVPVSKERVESGE